MLSRHYRKIKQRKTGDALELYDLDADPGESTNIAAEFPDIIQKLKNIGLEQYAKMIPPSMGYKSWVVR